MPLSATTWLTVGLLYNNVQNVKSFPVVVYCALPVLVLFYLLCMGTTGVCGGEGAEKAVGGGVMDLPSPSDVGPEPLRTEPSRSANFAAAELRREEGGNMGDSELKRRAGHSLWPLRGKKTLS